MTRTLILFFSILLLGISCTTKDVECTNPRMEAYFIGYTVPELDTLIIRKYRNDGTFTQKLDSMIFIHNNGLNTLFQNGDTIAMAAYREEFNIKADFDWQIIIPSINKTINIGPFTIEQKKGKCRSGLFNFTRVNCDCPNNVKILKLNSQTITFPENKYYLPFYIRK